LGPAVVRKGNAHLREADPVLAALMDTVGPIKREWRSGGGPDEYYAALVRAIVGQQLSTKAARAIWGRLLGYFGDHPPTPAQVLAADPEAMRAAAGLSRAKVTFLRSLAEHIEDGSLELERLSDMPDDEATAELTAVRGIGEWSAQMFLMFQLGRPDVLATGDLGIRRAVQLTYKLPELPPPTEVTRIGASWSPYRTLACMYLWQALDGTPAG
jgi:DNA-3-methyladenine glycosylase II